MSFFPAHQDNALPASWTIASLNDVTELNPRPNLSALPDGMEVHFVPMAAAAEDFRGLDISARRRLSEVRKGYTAFQGGDVLLAKITPCMENGKGGLVPMLPMHLAFGSTEFHVLRPTDVIEGRWLSHFLSRPSFRREARQNMTGTAGQLRVPSKWLANVKIPVAPKSEQARVIAKLEELLSDLDAGVAELKAAQQKLQRYRQSLLKAAVEGALTAEWRAKNPPTETGAELLQRILGERRARWEEQQLAKFAAQGKTPPKGWKDKYPEPQPPKTEGLPELPEGWVWASVNQIVADSSYGTSAKCAYDSPGVPVLRIPNISRGELDFRDLKHATVDLALERGDELQSGDVLVIRTNGSIGLVGRCAAVIATPDKPHYFASYLVRLRCVESTASHRWIATFLTSTRGRRWLEARAASSAGQHNISLSSLLTTPVPLPALEEQLKSLLMLAEGLEAIDRYERAVCTSLAQSAAQRQNLLRAAFRGELVPQDPNDEPASVLLERLRAERGGAVKPARAERKGRKTKGAA